MGETIYAPGFSVSREAKAARVPEIRARYDNATQTSETQRNWWAADYLSAKAANSFGVRRTLRMRSRHEVSNNPFLYGICNNNADDLISTGPTLQVRTSNAKYNRAVESLWREWCEEVAYVEKLRTLKLARTVDGEGFLVFKTVSDLEHPVKLYPCDVEADQVTTPAPASAAEYWVDGLTLHPITGKPVKFHVLKMHPGDYYFPTLNPQAVEVIAARNVIHWFPKFRPGQVRGVPVFTSSLDLFTELRAYRRAVLGAAEIAADFAAVITNENAAAYTDDADAEWEAFKRVPITRKMMTSLPAGAKMDQFEAKQPISSYTDYQATCLGEACRPLSYPLNLALGSSQKFNFSSSKLDHVNYRNGLSVERVDCDRTANTPTFREFYTEAVLSGAVEPWDGLKIPPHEWHWPGFESLDPVVDAQADHDRLAHGTHTYREFWARRGYDWRDVMAQQHTERAEMDKLELVFGDPLKKTLTETVDTGDDGEESDGASKPKPATQPAPHDAKPDAKPAEKPAEKVVKKALSQADVQNTALNGAQVTSLIAVCDKLAEGQYTGPATAAILRGAFPGLTDDLIDTIISELEGHVVPASPSEKEPASAA